jgi:hypothetical protein
LFFAPLFLGFEKESGSKILAIPDSAPVASHRKSGAKSKKSICGLIATNISDFVLLLPG